MKKLPAHLLTLYADLLQQVQMSTVPPGSIKAQKIKGTEYLKANTTVGVQRRTIYIGAADDADAQKRAQAIKAEMDRAKVRRQTVRLLRDGGIPVPSTELARVLEALASVNLFRQGLVLVGTAAYQCYSPLVGAALPAASMMTRDADLATASPALTAGSIAPAADGNGEIGKKKQDKGGETTAETLEDILRRADPTFAAIPGLNRKAFPSHFRTATGFLVDVLVPFRRRTDANPMPIPGLRAGGTPMQHLDWLIRSPSPAVALYGAGVLIQVPQPARYAVHKLIVAQQPKRGTAKRQKDLLQAKSLFEALGETDAYSLQDALEDAASRGQKGWSRPIERSLREIEISTPTFSARPSPV